MRRRILVAAIRDRRGSELLCAETKRTNSINTCGHRRQNACYGSFAVAEALDGPGTAPNNIMVFFGEIDRASSSFGGGRLAPPVPSV
jgi:hypothetical protein